MIRRRSRIHSICWMQAVILGATMASCAGFTRSLPTYSSSPVSVERDKGFTSLGLESDGNQDFWAKQKELAEEMTNTAEMSLKEEQRQKFAERRIALVAESAYFTVLIFCILWGVANTPFTPFSYVFGALFGTAYSYGLGKYVETLGGSVEDAGDIQGAGVGQARFAFLILLFVIVGKFRSQGLQEMPAILGFFTYQLASLSQGLKEFDD